MALPLCKLPVGVWFSYIRRRRVLSGCFRLYLCHYCARFSCHGAQSVLKNIIHVYSSGPPIIQLTLEGSRQSLLCDGTCEKTVSQTISLNLAYLSLLAGQYSIVFLAGNMSTNIRSCRGKSCAQFSQLKLTRDDLVVACGVLPLDQRKF